MQDYAVKLLKTMLEIYSPSGNEKELSDFLFDEMKTLGFSVRKDSVGNVVGELGSGSPTIFLCGHMDTVPGFIPVKIEDNTLYGRGAVDAKAPLAAMIVASSLLKGEVDAKIVVACVIDEEGHSQGIRNLLKDGINADYAIFGEPSGVEKITIGYKGVLRLQVLCETKPGPGHSSANPLYSNAIQQAIELWKELQLINSKYKKIDSDFHSLTSSITKIEGGQDYSTTPSRCFMNIDIRIPPHLTTSQVFAEIDNTIKQFSRVNPQVNVTAKIEEAIEPFESDSKSILIRALSCAIREVRGKTPMLVRKTGTGDMNLLGRAMHIPTVTYGPGESTLCHTIDEHIPIKEYLDGIEVYRNAIKWIIKLHRGN